MAGIYLHIPFCKQACNYCNFHFSTSLRQKDALIQAMLMELELQKNYLEGEEIESIYFGGGTPSLLNNNDLHIIFEKIYTLHRIAPDAEITLEANPDDLSLDKLRDLKSSPVNRLSIGIQSFHERDLVFMNRAHTASEARKCLENALASGFEHITIDLIYGTPNLSDEEWLENISIAANYEILHLSCYCLTLEPKTPLAKHIQKGIAPTLDEGQAARQFELLMDAAAQHEYTHYEISNFAKNDEYARHNSNYWRNKKYLGIGPSAHSFNQNSRHWNIANNMLYINEIKNNVYNPEIEILTDIQKYNEWVMIGLRTMWGCDARNLEAFGKEKASYFEQKIQTFIEKNYVTKKEGKYSLTRSGKQLADHIAMELFLETA